MPTRAQTHINPCTNISGVRVLRRGSEVIPAEKDLERQNPSNPSKEGERKKKSSSSEKGEDGPRIKNGFKRKLANDGSTTHGDVLVNRVTLLCTRTEKKRKTNPGSDERPTQVA